jgi:hypothetical protein
MTTCRDAAGAGLEITTFRLLGCTCDEFVAANADVDDWLARQPGFLWRRIAERDDGVIVDALLWNSRADGEAAMYRLLEELGHLPIHAMIDQSTVAWSVSPVRHAIGN